MADVELGNAGGATPTNADDAFVYEPLLPRPKEPYLTIDAIAAMHSKSNLDVSNLEASYGLTVEEAASRLQLYGKNCTCSFCAPKIDRFDVLLPFASLSLSLHFFLTFCNRLPACLPLASLPSPPQR
jgi:hypothetical protein